ncbi:hypothetical protein [uncultured Azohydromonas sp.]|uniref:hypothetical protein n=1 Tax=uncultured Azohydromonas sp. TaxID=487342 RepID=UPI002614687A|nr:hypothetical protein [uncultured Azohydromonas sp.]
MSRRESPRQTQNSRLSNAAAMENRTFGFEVLSAPCRRSLKTSKLQDFGTVDKAVFFIKINNLQIPCVRLFRYIRPALGRNTSGFSCSAVRRSAKRPAFPALQRQSHTSGALALSGLTCISSAETKHREMSGNSCSLT